MATVPYRHMTCRGTHYQLGTLSQLSQLSQQ